MAKQQPERAPDITMREVGPVTLRTAHWPAPEGSDHLPLLFFSHRAPANVDAPSMKKIPALTSGPEIKCGSDVAAKTHSARYVEPEPIGEKSVLEVAREMRRNTSTEKRRPKLLPAPSISELPFIKPSGTTA